MIPLMAGDPQDKIEQTIVIPPGPIDESNEWGDYKWVYQSQD
jgi:hypothetical protein